MDNRLPIQYGVSYDFAWGFEKTYQGPDVVYHYTSPEAMMNIFGKNRITLRFSRITCQNDYSEGLEVLPLYKVICKEMLDNGDISESIFSDIISMEPLLLRNFTGEEESQYCCDHDVYVCCFSEKQDTLPLWNYYLKNDKYLGYSIGFDSTAFQVGHIMDYGWIALAKVIYTQREKREAIINLIMNVRDNMSDDSGLILGMVEREIPSGLAFLKYLFKNEHSSNEQEIRALLFYPHSTDVNLSEEFLSKDAIEFRYKEGITIPYIDVEFDKGIFRNICIAPSIRYQGMDKAGLKETIEYEMLSEFLKRNRIAVNPETISASTVPIRY